MRPHPSIVSLLLIGACGGAPGGDWAPPAEDLRGRLAMSWSIDGAPLTTERCTAERIAFMEVEVVSTTGAGSLAYTQVRCDLDRYSLQMTPLGRVVVRVGGMGTDSRERPCLRRYGEALVTAGTTYPEQPTPVTLRAIADACR